MTKDFKERMLEVLMNKDFDFYYSRTSLETAIELLNDKYGVDENKLLDGLNRIENIRYANRNEMLQGDVARFIDKKILGIDVPDNTEILITNHGNYDYSLSRDLDITQLSKGVIAALSAKEGDNYKIMGYGENFGELSSYVREQLANEISPDGIMGHFVFDGSKSRLMNEYFDILMDIDGKNLVKNYFEMQDDFKYDPSVKELNDAIGKIKIRFSEGYSDISEDRKFYYEGKDSFYLKEDIDRLNEAFCQYAGTKLKELPADEADFYRGQIEALPGITKEHLAILDNPKAVELDNKQIFEDKIRETLYNNSITGEREVEAVTKVMFKLREYGFEDKELIGHLDKIKGIDYVNEKDMQSGFFGAKHPNVEFDENHLFGRSIFSKPGSLTNNVRINIGVEPGQAQPEDLMNNKHFLNGMVDALSIKPEIAHHFYQDSEIYYHSGMENKYSAVSNYIKDYIISDLQKDDKAVDFIKDSSSFNLLQDNKEGKYEKHFDLLLENDNSLIKKFMFDENLSPKGMEFLDKATDVIRNFGNVSESDFNKSYCEYLGEVTRDLSNDAYEFMKNRVESLPGVTKEHLEAMDAVRENVKENIKEDIIDKAKETSEEIAFD